MSLYAAKTLDVGALFAALNIEKKISRYRKNQIIFSQGDQSDSMFYIENGSVKLTVVSRQGKEVVIWIAGPGFLFGESCMSLDHHVRFHSAVALADTDLIRMSRSAVMRMLRLGGDLSVHFLSCILQQNARTQVDLASRLVDSAEESLLHIMSALKQSTNKQSPSPKISQQTLAEMMGVSRQRVNVLMKRFGRTTPGQPSQRKLPRN